MIPRTSFAAIDDIASDFAPDNENAAVTVVPEPTAAFTLGTALAGFAMLRRKYRR